MAAPVLDSSKTSADDILTALEEVFWDTINSKVQVETSEELDGLYEPAAAAANKGLDERKG